MHHLSFLQDLAAVMTVAALATVLFRLLKQPVVLGYILAGAIIGPKMPPFSFISNEKNIDTFAELGVIFLMFSLGLEFSLRKLQKVGATAFITASLEILVMIFAGYELGRIFGWSQMDSIFLGAILSISSTTIIVKALEELGKTKEKFAQIIVGILIVEDVLAIALISLLTGLAKTGQVAPLEIGKILLGLGSFLGILLVGGLIVVPRLLNFVARFKSDEMLLITVLGLCFGICLVTVDLGYSVALGAFLIGAVIAEARQILKIEMLMQPVRDLFSAVFFVSIGLLIDPAVIVQYIGPILIITAVVVGFKVFACSLGGFISGNDTKTSLRIGMSLAQIGEFSFIIASLGLSLNATSAFLYPIAIAVSALTTLLTPYLIQSSDKFVTLFDRLAPKPLVRATESYTQWVGGLGQNPESKLERQIISKLCWQIGINMLIVAGIFISAAFLYQKAFAHWPNFPGGIDGVKALLWVAAIVVSFPLLIAVWRKLEVASMLVSEMSVNIAKAGPRAAALQSFISASILAVSTGALVLVLLLLSTSLLPSWNILLLVLLLVSLLGFLLYRGSVKLYAGAQYALKDTFDQEPEPVTIHAAHGHAPAPAHPPVPAPLPPLLRHAELETIALKPGTPAVGKLISELQLRSETGASVVGIQRGSESLINPAPHEELHEGDELLLIGTADQLKSARTLLTSAVEAA